MSSKQQEIKPLKKVVGLKYCPLNDAVPSVLLKGSGMVAEAILDAAETIENGPLVIEDSSLLEQLYQLPMNAGIRPEMFDLVAILLVHVYTIEQRLSTKQKMGKAKLETMESIKK